MQQQDAPSGKTRLERRRPEEVAGDALAFPPSWIRQMLSGFLDGDHAVLVRELHRRCASCTEPRQRTHLGMALMFAGDPLGAKAFLSALDHGDPELRQTALAVFESLDATDIGSDGRPGQLAIDARELAIAIAAHLEPPIVVESASKPMREDVSGVGTTDRARLATAAGRLLFPQLLPMFQRLRNDPDRAVARVAIDQFLRRDEDAGTIAFIAGELALPAASKGDRGWHLHLCAVLEDYARRGGGRHCQAAAVTAAGCLERWLDGHAGQGGRCVSRFRRHRCHEAHLGDGGASTPRGGVAAGEGPR